MAVALRALRLLLPLSVCLLLGAQVALSSGSSRARVSDGDSGKGSKEKSSKEKAKKENSGPNGGSEQPVGDGGSQQSQGSPPPASPDSQGQGSPPSEDPAKKPEDESQSKPKSESKKKSDGEGKKDEEEAQSKGESPGKRGEEKKKGDRKDDDARKPGNTPDQDGDSGELKAQGQDDGAPKVNKTVGVEPVQGEVTVKPKGSDEFVPLGELGQLPLGSVVDARQGVVEIVLPVTPQGAVQSATFSEAAFKVMQSQVGTHPVVLRLVGGDFGACAAPARGKASAARSKRSIRRSKRSIRRLWGKGKGLFRTRGRYSSASVRGTNWLTEDRCDGTLTRVKTGVVVVCDFGLGRKVAVRAGESYLARPRTGRLPAPVAERRCRV